MKHSCLVRITFSADLLRDPIRCVECCIDVVQVFEFLFVLTVGL